MSVLIRCNPFLRRQKRTSSIKVVDFQEMEAARKAKEAVLVSKTKDEKHRKTKETREANKVKKLAKVKTPEGIRQALESIVQGANKVTQTDRKVIQDYLAGGNNPDSSNESIKVILLNESRHFADDKSAVILGKSPTSQRGTLSHLTGIEQIKLKIDYTNRTLKKVKGIKKFKLKPQT